MKFSQRIGKTAVRSVLQVEEIDKTLEVKLWNFIVQHFFDRYEDIDFYSDTKRAKICKTIWVNFFNNVIDDIPRYSNTGTIVATSIITYFKEWYFKSMWYDKYDFLEYLVYLTDESFKSIFAEILNYTLKTELAGYRLINFQIVQITSNEEIFEIEQAINESKSNPIRTHLDLALSHLSNKQKPDYRNSIKESISAIEYYCSLLTGEPKATLGKALAIIEKNHNLHGALKTAYTALYGYTSDEGGIRHSLMKDTANISFADAKYMLVICSAFINYMNTKIQ